MVDVTSTVTIAKPVEVVAKYVADPSRTPEWYENIRSVRWETDPPLAVGTRLAFEAHFLRRTMHYTYEVIEYVPGRRLVMRSVEGPFPMETTYTWASRGEGRTEMTLQNRGEPTGFSRIVAPAMALAMRRAMDKDLLVLQRIVESGRV